jgi:hypothetical protein
MLWIRRTLFRAPRLRSRPQGSLRSSEVPKQPKDKVLIHESSNLVWASAEEPQVFVSKFLVLLMSDLVQYPLKDLVRQAAHLALDMKG